MPFPFSASPVRGMSPGQLVVIGGKTSMGKTVVGCHAAIHAAGSGHRTLLVSLEMDKGEMMRRLIAMVARVNHSDLQTGELSPTQRAAVRRAAERIADWPLGIVTGSQHLEGNRGENRTCAPGRPPIRTCRDRLSRADPDRERF